MLPLTSRDRRERLVKTTMIRLSTSVVMLYPLKQDLPIRTIIEELIWLKEIYPDLAIPTKIDNKPPKREEYVRLLCEYREIYFSDFPEVKEDFELQLLQLDQDDVSSSVQDRTTILQHPYYTLSEEEKELFS